MTTSNSAFTNGPVYKSFTKRVAVIYQPSLIVLMFLRLTPLANWSIDSPVTVIDRALVNTVVTRTQRTHVPILSSLLFYT